ncbi:MAG: alpha-ketoacid dehydrogenase subunit beta [bacterium]|jgi:pyruvate/2-oxoglutarate/acetoin dehydrogenase E1 component
MKNMTYRDAIKEAVREEMLRDPDVFIMGEDVGVFGNVFKVFWGLYDEFGPERVRSTPLSEMAIAGAAVGAACLGSRPVAEIMYIDFMTVCLDPIINQAAKLCYNSGGQIKCPVVIRTQGGIGKSKGSHHSQSLEAWFAHTPGLITCMPSTPADAKGMLKAAIRSNNPVIFIEHKLLYATVGPVPEDEDYIVPLGKGDVKVEGDDVTIVATSYQVVNAIKAAKILEEKGISAEVVDPRTLYPLDEDIIVNSVKKTGKAVVVQESPEKYGIASEFAYLIQEKAFDYLDAPVKRVAPPHVVVPYSPALEDLVRPDAETIVKAVEEMF